MLLSTALVLSPLFLSAAASPIEPRADPAPVKETNCNGKSYVYEELAGFGIFPGDARDKFGDTIGGVGSSIALDKKSWKKKEGEDEAYTGILYGLPDRGWNTQGTQNTAGRIQKFGVTLTIVDATVAKPAKPNFVMEYLDTIILKGPDGTPTTGLDADATGHISFPGFPDLPGATYTGDGFGGAGPGGKRISLDAEGLVLGDDDTFWVSDEYGPYVYQFSASGTMLQAIRPVDALIPMRNGAESFSANSPPTFDASRKVTPANPTTGRQNNQGFEGLTVSADGKTLYVLLQSAARQEGGAAALTRRHTRFLQYDISKKTAKYEAEYVVELPLISNGKIAAQSEVHFISDSQFLILARDSGAGHGQSSSTSLYRNADIFDISKATDIKSATNDKFDGAIANSATGVLNAGITPAAYCPWIEFNNNSELNKFGAHNGGAQDAFLLNEKWESLALAPVAGKFSDNGNKDGEEYYLISLSDNDFITQNGFINGGQIPYKDASGFNLDTQALVFKVRLPKGAKPLEG